MWLWRYMYWKLDMSVVMKVGQCEGGGNRWYTIMQCVKVEGVR